MSHEIDFSTGTAAIAFVGDRSAVWHGLGAQLDKNSSIEEWKKAAGMDWTIEESPVMFKDVDGNDNQFEGRKVVYRSDTKGQLGIVGSNFKTIQPGEILEFFADIVKDTGIYIDTAGVLFEGKRFWASAYTNNALTLKNGDKITGNLLLATGTDGTLATTASFVSTRTVCNNTLRIALAENTDARVRVTHRQTFDPTRVKEQLGVLDTSWLRFQEQVLALNARKITDKDARAFIQKLVSKDPADMTDSEFAESDLVMSLYSGKGMGAELAYGNAYGVLNAITQHVDYDGRAKPSAKMWNSLWGTGANLKQDAFNQLLEMSL